MFAIARLDARSHLLAHARADQVPRSTGYGVDDRVDGLDAHPVRRHVAAGGAMGDGRWMAAILGNQAWRGIGGV
jgi:hypothetical protein